MSKILFLVTQSDLGGAQKYVYDLYTSLQGFEISLAAGKYNGKLFKKIKGTGLKHLKRIPKRPFLCLKEIKEVLEREKPDVLHLNSFSASFFGSIAARKKDIKVIYTVHGWAFLEPNIFKKIFCYLAEKITEKYKDKYIVLSDLDYKQGLKITKKEKIVKIYNGIKPLDFLSKEDARKALNIKGDNVIGAISNLYKTKGLKYLSETNLSNIYVIGEGPERKNLRGLNLLGHIPDAYKYLKAFDVFCLPSLKEGFPFVILEALQANIPIVATKVGSLPEILEEKYLVEPKNTKALREKIQTLLKTKETPKREFPFNIMLNKTKQCILSTLNSN